MLSVFSEGGIDIEAFKLLDEETLRRLLLPGVFLKFIGTWNEKKGDLIGEFYEVQAAKRRKVSDGE